MKDLGNEPVGPHAAPATIGRLVDDVSQTRAIERNLAAFLGRVRAETRIPGIGVALSVGGQRAYAQSGTLRADDDAPLTADARFSLGCVVKALLALTALELAEHGRLALDDAIGRHLPELARTRVGRGVRIEHLLSHTSGYKGTNVLEAGARRLSWPGFVDYLRRAPQHFAAGTVFNYEHSEAVLLARVLERASGRKAAALLRELVLEPLSIRSQSADAVRRRDPRAGHHVYDPATGRFSCIEPERPAPFWRAAFSSAPWSLRELLTLAEALAGADARRAFGARALERMRRPAVVLPATVGGPLRELLPVTFGLGAAGLRGGWHANTGVTQGQCIGLRYDPARRLAVAVGLNALAPHLRDLVLNAVCEALPSRSEESPSPPRAEPELRELAGVYEGGGKSRVTASFTDERLVCEIGTRGSAKALRVELALDESNALRLHSPIPQVSIGFFRAPACGTAALMLGLNAYKLVSGPAARAG